ncbi:MAG TPA: ATP-binding protein, partial [Candidatus Sulfotelmatobacter sp.]|nr:ATP-binding protein [Candidatus Sulfotelmatobacter sp.]
QRLLAFARRQDLSVDPVDLGELVREMTDLLNRSVGTGIVIEIRIPDRMDPVLADSNQLELALLNLVVNARDAMPNGGTICISLQVENVAKPEGELAAGRYGVLSVADEGHGMDDDTLQKAIEPFFSTKELGKGTGLGLSMIHGLALQLQGALRLTSTPGKGTRAELWIPVSDESPVVSKDTEVAEPDQRVKPLRVLLVDDDFLIAMSSVDMLVDLGHEVVEAHSGKEALAHLKDDGRFDLLITDYSMPEMTGGDLANAARDLFPDLPILIASGYAELPPGIDFDVVRLAKPYSQQQLAVEIESVLRGLS